MDRTGTEEMHVNISLTPKVLECISLTNREEETQPERSSVPVPGHRFIRLGTWDGNMRQLFSVERTFASSYDS